MTEAEPVAGQTCFFCGKPIIGEEPVYKTGTFSTNPFHLACSQKSFGDDPRAGQDTTPSIVEQAKRQGWQAGIFDFGKAEARDVHYFNPGLIERPDGLWLIVRRAELKGTDTFGDNKLWAIKLNDETLKPEWGKLLKFIGAEENEHFEDPRVIYHNELAYVAACSFLWYGTEWTGAHQVLGVFKCVPGSQDQDWDCQKVYRPEIGGNSANVEARGARNEKNWAWFFHGGQLHLYYHTNPWRIAKFTTSFSDGTPYELEPGVHWNHGEIRGGTPPVLVNGIYWTFFHSSVPWVGRFRRYHMGVIGFDSNPPFTPLYITEEPLLTGNQTDPWLPRKPLVVFPCGARIKDGKWLVVLGVNDLRSGWLSLPHSDILRLAKPLTPGGAVEARLAHNQEVAGSNPAPATSSNGIITKEAIQQIYDIDQTVKKLAGEATLGDKIRFHVNALAELEDGNPSRHNRILTELRRRKLAPQPRRR